MHIAELETENFRGQTFSMSLGLVTLVTGDNFSGKTTVADAIRFALAGTVPGAGKTAPMLWDAVAGNPDEAGQVFVEVKLDNVRTSSTKLIRSEKGKVSQDDKHPHDIALHPLLLDPRAFFRMTTQERVSAIFAASPQAEITHQMIEEAVWKVEAMPATERDRILRVMIDEAQEMPLERLTKTWKERLTDAKAEFKRVSGAFAGMQLPPKMPQAPKGLAALKAQRDGLLIKRGELGNLLRAGSDGAALRQMIEAKEKDLATLVEMKAPENQPKPEEPIALKDLTKLQAELKAKIAESALVTMELQRLTQAGRKCPTCGHESGWADSETVRERTAVFKTKVDTLENEIDTLEARVSELTGIAAEFGERMQEWDDHQRHVASCALLEKEIATLKGRLTSASQNNDERIRELTLEVEKLTAIEADIDALQQEERAFSDYQRLVNEREKMEGRVIMLGCEVKCLTDSIKAVSEMVSCASETAFNRVLRVARAFTDGLMNSPLEFRDGELGRRVSSEDRAQGRRTPIGAWIPHTAFSGTEETLAMIGFSLALAHDAPFKLAIIDELGRMTFERKQAVLKRLCELVAAGTIHQALVIDSNEWSHDALATCGAVTLVEI